MGMSAASHLCASSSLRALTVLFVLAALVSDVEGRHHRHVCPHFSCGGLSNISYPFRRQGDPSGCGVQSYELVCTDTDATIRIGSGTYKVLSINSTYSYFWVVDADLDIQSSCPLPQWDYYPARWINRNSYRWRIEFSHDYFYPPPFYIYSGWAIFVNCSQPIENNDADIYEPVSCLSNSSFIYLVTDYWYVFAGNLEPSCGYLAMTPLGGPGMPVPMNTSYPDVVKFMRSGFALRFPFSYGDNIRECLANNMQWVSVWSSYFFSYAWLSHLKSVGCIPYVILLYATACHGFAVLSIKNQEIVQASGNRSWTFLRSRHYGFVLLNNLDQLIMVSSLFSSTSSNKYHMFFPVWNLHMVLTLDSIFFCINIVCGFWNYCFLFFIYTNLVFYSYLQVRIDAAGGICLPSL